MRCASPSAKRAKRAKRAIRVFKAFKAFKAFKVFKANPVLQAPLAHKGLRASMAFKAPLV